MMTPSIPLLLFFISCVACAAQVVNDDGGSGTGDGGAAVSSGGGGAQANGGGPATSTVGSASGGSGAAAEGWTETAVAGAPPWTSLNPAVWTGSEMFVWGGGYNQWGQGNHVHLNVGGRYDPIADSWSTVSSEGAPSPRARHATVWTGSLVIVWGGLDVADANNLYTGARYDPATNSWTPTSTAGAPLYLYVPAAVWTGSEMIVWGTNVGGRYDPTTDSWTSVSTMGAPVNERRRTAVWTGSEMITWGGIESVSSNPYPDGSSNKGARYDPVNDAWTPVTTSGAPTARHHHTAIWTGSEMIVWGGANGSSLNDTGARYDPVTDSWSAVTTNGAPSPRHLHTAVWTGSEMIIWGGYDNGGAFAGDPLDTGGKYDPATDSWEPVTAVEAPSARFLHTAVWTGSEMIVWGGNSDRGGFQTGGRYQP